LAVNVDRARLEGDFRCSRRKAFATMKRPIAIGWLDFGSFRSERSLISFAMTISGYYSGEREIFFELSVVPLAGLLRLLSSRRSLPVCRSSRF